MKKHISIIIPCYNQAHFLDQALQSVLNQTYLNWECLLINDGSTDETEIIGTEYFFAVYIRFIQNSYLTIIIIFGFNNLKSFSVLDFISETK